MKSRLIALLREKEKLVNLMPQSTTALVRLADHLLANGVIVPPVKVGQMVYVLRSQTSDGKNLYLRAERISHYRVFGETSFMCFESQRGSVADHLWHTSVFLTREEAEKALAERRAE